MLAGSCVRNMLLFVPAAQKKKRPTSFADELAARIKGEVPVRQDEERSCELPPSFEKYLCSSGGLMKMGDRRLWITIHEVTQMCYLNVY